MSSTQDSLEQILASLDRIEKHLKIVPDREATISDGKSSINQYEIFAKTELKLDEKTITNHLSTISRFLAHSNGIITKDSVKNYLESSDSDSWKSNQTKALRRYIRDFLKLGSWIEEFRFSKIKAKIKEIPSDEELARFCSILSYPVQLVFLVLLSSGLRIGEVLSLKVEDIDFETSMINASAIHQGSTKSSLVSFVTEQTAEFLTSYIEDMNEDQKIFSMSSRSVQQEFKDASDTLGISVTPHLLRTVFAEKCVIAGVKDKYINVFCGRVSQGILAKNYTDYSPKSLRNQYDIAEPYLTLDQISSE